MFKDIKEGFQIHVLDTTDVPRYTLGRVVKVSDPRIPPMPQYQPGQPMPPYPQLQDRVIDLTVDVNGKTDTYVVPENRDVAMSSGLTFACGVEPIVNQVTALRRTAADSLSKREFYERSLSACDAILEETNPDFRMKREQDKKIKGLEEKVERIGSSFEELKELLIRKLNQQ